MLRSFGALVFRFGVISAFSVVEKCLSPASHCLLVVGGCLAQLLLRWQRCRGVTSSHFASSVFAPCRMYARPLFSFGFDPPASMWSVTENALCVCCGGTRSGHIQGSMYAFVWMRGLCFSFVYHECSHGARRQQLSREEVNSRAFVVISAISRFQSLCARIRFFDAVCA